MLAQAPVLNSAFTRYMKPEVKADIRVAAKPEMAATPKDAVSGLRTAPQRDDDHTVVYYSDFEINPCEWKQLRDHLQNCAKLISKSLGISCRLLG